MDVLQNQDDFASTQLPALQDIPQLTLVGHFPRQINREDVPSYFFGQIQPQVDIVKEVYVFQLAHISEDSEN